jgi:hypothetical protein
MRIRDTCTPRFWEVLFTTAKKWENRVLICPSMDRRIKNMWSIHSVEDYSAIEKEGKYKPQHG